MTKCIDNGIFIHFDKYGLQGFLDLVDWVFCGFLSSSK